MKDRLRLLRPAHCLKNILVLLPLIFSGRLSDGASVRRAAPAFVCFCLLASAIYVLKDLCDRKADRRHPRKRARPLASGAVRPVQAEIMALVLLAGLVGLGVWMRLPGGAWLCLGAYFLLNLAYSMELKNIPVLDVALLAGGYLLRVQFGAEVIGVPVSSWLYLTVLFFTFYFGFGKRRGELRQGSASRRVLEFYSAAFLDRAMQLCMTLALVFYSLWSAGAGMGGQRMLWTVPLAVCICLKYSRAAEADADGDPVEVLLHDRTLLGMAVAFAALVLALLYL